MPTLSEIRNRITGIIQDERYGPEDIDSYINEGIDTIAQLVLLPALESSGSVVTEADVPTVAIPVSWNYDRNLYSVVSTNTEDDIKIYSSLALLLRDYPDYAVSLESGDVKAITIRAGSLIYYPIPTTVDTLVCGFYQKPTHLSLDGDTPSCIPDFLQYKLLVSFVCKEIYALIEDGVDGVKVNTDKHLMMFEQGIAQLSSLMLEGKSRPEPHRHDYRI